MIIQCKHLQIELTQGSTFVLADACGYKLICVAGAFWITQHHQSTDWVLQSGESLTIENPGKVVISTCNDSATFCAQLENELSKRGVNQVRNLGNRFPSRTLRCEA